MLPSRGVVRSLPSVGVRRQITSRNVTAGRQYGTLQRNLRSAHGLNATSTFQLRAKQAVAPVGLGTVASTRNLSWPSMSLWGYGKKTPEPAEVTTSGETPSAVVAGAPEASKSASTQQAATIPSTVAEPSSAAQVEATNAGLADPAQTTDLSVISDLVNNPSANSTAAEILNRTEDIGYLASLGLDYGWGPSSMMMWFLEHVHVWSGLGWAGSIAATAVLLRIVLLYPLIQSTKFSADMKRMQSDPRFPELNAKLKAAISHGDRNAQAQAQALNGMLRKEYNVPFSKMGWSFLPIPFSYGLFRVVTGMTHIPVPSLETSGFLWFTDLTLSDPYMILPGLATGLMVAAIDLNAKNSPQNQVGMVKKMKYVLVPLMFFGTSFLSAAVNLMGVSFGAATLVTTIFTNNNTVRRFFDIPAHAPPPKPEAIPTTATYEAPRPKQSMRERLTSSFDEAKKAASDGISNMTGQAQMSVDEKADKQRKADIAKMEAKRQQQERDAFNEKYKGKKAGKP